MSTRRLSASPGVGREAGLRRLRRAFRGSGAAPTGTAWTGSTPRRSGRSRRRTRSRASRPWRCSSSTLTTGLDRPVVVLGAKQHVAGRDALRRCRGRNAQAARDRAPSSRRPRRRESRARRARVPRPHRARTRGRASAEKREPRAQAQGRRAARITWLPCRSRLPRKRPAEVGRRALLQAGVPSPDAVRERSASSGSRDALRAASSRHPFPRRWPRADRLALGDGERVRRRDVELVAAEVREHAVAVTAKLAAPPAACDRPAGPSR